MEKYSDSLIERIGVQERQYVMEVLAGQYRASAGGLFMARLEREICNRFHVNFAITHNSGTATLHSCLAAIGVNTGDEVIVPPLKMASTSLAVLQCGARPIFADVDYNSFTISAQAIEKVITKQTKAIIVVALYGLAPDMDEIMTVAKKYNLPIIEDSAQAYLAYYKNRLVGTIGTMGSFSLQSSKHVTSGEGGFVITDDAECALLIRRFGSLGYAAVGAAKGKITKQTVQNPDYQRHLQLGWNYRLPELCSAVALAQMERIEELVERRQQVAALFTQTAENCGWLRQQFVPGDCVHSYWSWVVALEHPNISWQKFYQIFRGNGGDGIYAAWQLTYREPMFAPYLSEANCVEKVAAVCQQAEYLQPRLLQFKTNYWRWQDAERQAKILQQTIKQLDES